MADKKDKLVRENNEIVAGEFTFVYKSSFAAWRSKLFSSSSIKERAKDLMAAHYAFYGKLEDQEYVTVGSTLNCSCGTESIKIELKIDHGVEAPNGKAVLTCQDCDTDINNIKNFGSCKCDISKYDILPHPTELSGIEDDTGKGKYKCFPILGREWIAQDKDFVICVVGLEGNILELLEKSAVLICQYGGMITIEEVEEKKEEEQEEQEEEEEGEVEEESERNPIEINDWLVAYAGEPTREGGTPIEDLKSENRNTLGEENLQEKGIRGVNWYSYEPEKNGYVEKQYEEAGKLDEFLSNDCGSEYIDSRGHVRYWVAVGPEVLRPNYNRDVPYDEQTLNESQFKYGTEIDVVLQNPTAENEAEKIVYIECIVGDVKGNTHPDGVFQTGKAYPKSGLKDDLTRKDGSYIEFCRDDKAPNGNMSDYFVKEIILYEREW